MQLIIDKEFDQGQDEFDPGYGGSGDFSLFRIQTDPGVHSASYKVSTGAFPWRKTAERRTNHPTSS